MAAEYQMLFILALPVIGILISGIFLKKSSEAQIRLFKLITIGVFFLAAALYWEALQGEASYFWHFPHLELTLSLHLDPLGGLFVFITAFVWMVSSWIGCTCFFQRSMDVRSRLFFMSTLTSTLGVFLAGDLITLFLFYELMTICSYGLVMADGKEEAVSAARMYLVFGILSGLFLLTGILLLFSQGNSLFLKDLSPLSNSLIVFSFLFGFGIKAGMVPLMGWMPQAYKAASPSGAAVLSGVLSKTGIYGILRVVMAISFSSAGSYLGMVGIVGMLWGGYAALGEKDPKRILAFSSVSQLGFILMGIGSSMLMGGYYGALQGVMFHAFNHSLFKSGLFLTMGVLLQAVCRKGEMAVRYSTYVFMLGLIGIPFFSGGASKILLHHAMADLFSFFGDFAYLSGELIFLLFSTMTVLYCVKLYRILNQNSQSGEEARDLTPYAYWPLFLFSTVILVLGLIPQWAERFLLGPAVECLIEYERLGWSAFQSYYAVNDVLMVMATLLAAGLFLRYIGFDEIDRKRSFYWENGYFLYRPLMKVSWCTAVFIGYHMEERFQQSYDILAAIGANLVVRGQRLEKGFHNAYEQISDFGNNFVGKSYLEKVDRSEMDMGIVVITIIMASLFFFLMYLYYLG